MSDNVHLLTGISAPHARVPQQDVIDILKEALADAERGDMQAIGLCSVTFRHAVETTWSSTNAPANLMIAAVSRLHHRILTAASEDSQ